MIDELLRIKVLIVIDIRGNSASGTQSSHPNRRHHEHHVREELKTTFERVLDGVTNQNITFLILKNKHSCNQISNN